MLELEAVSGTGMEPSDVSVLPRPTLGFAKKSNSMRLFGSGFEGPANVRGPMCPSDVYSSRNIFV